MEQVIRYIGDPSAADETCTFGEYRTEDWISGGHWELTEGEPAGTWGVHPPYKTYYHCTSGSPLAHTKAVYSDFDYLMTVQLPEDGWADVVFRMKDESNFYYLRLDSILDTVYLAKRVDGVEHILAQVDADISPVICTHVRVICRGSHLSARILCDKDASFFRNENPGQTVADLTDDSFSSGVCGFIAQGGARFNNTSVVDLSGQLSMENHLFSVVTGAYGEIRSLKLKTEPFDVNFVTNESEHRYEVGSNQFLGEMLLRYRTDGENETEVSTGNSNDIRKTEQLSPTEIRVTYGEDSLSTGGIRGKTELSLTTTYSLEDDHLRMQAVLKNVSNRPMEVNDICLPISWNNHWQFEEPYEAYLAATDNFISHDASYLLLERAGGGGVKLLFTPDPRTPAALEHRTLCSTQLTWANPPEYYYIKSKSANRDPKSYLSPTSLTLAAGEEICYAFLMHQIGSEFSDVNDCLYREGIPAFQVNPGMIFPLNMTAQLDIRTKSPVHSVTSTDPDSEIREIFRDGERVRYALTFQKLGRIDVTVTYGDGKRGVLQFWTEEPLDKAIRRRGDFLMENCRITDPADCHLYSFLEWDNARNAAKEGGNRCSNNDYEQMYDGAGFIAEKQVYLPTQREISAIDDYLTRLVWEKEIIHGGKYDGFLCHKCCGGRCWSDPLPNREPYLCTRAYNYPRIYNTFYSMYKTARRYPKLSYRWDALRYLQVAGMVLRASLILQPWIGLMGEQTVPDIIDALRKEGEASMALGLHTLAGRKAQTMNRQPYPFASEFGTDSTGEEGAYTFAKMFGYRDTMVKTIDKSVAWTGKVPVWYWQTTSNRQDMEWWLFQYTVGLHGKIFHDYYLNETEHGEKAWGFVYPFKLSPFVHIHSGQPELIGPVGTSWGNYHASFPYNWDHGFPYSESAESDISLWAGLQLLSADVVEQDPVFGLTGYGCTVEKEGDALLITPQDGLGRRICLVDRRLSLIFETEQCLSAKIGEKQMTFTLRSVSNGVEKSMITAHGLPDGAYDIAVNGTWIESVTVSGKAVFEFTLSGQENTVTITGRS